MRVRPFFRWYDLWIGAYWDRANRTLYVCPLPCVGVRIEFARPAFRACSGACVATGCGCSACRI